MYQWDLKDIIHSTFFLWTTDGTWETNTSANEIVENAYFLFSKYLRQFQQKLLVFLPPFLLPFFFSSFTSFLCGQKTPISSFLIGNKCLQRLADFCKGIRRWQLTLLRCGFEKWLASICCFFSAKEHKKSLNAEVKVENKSCGRLFEPILISILLYKSIHLGNKIVKKLLEITDSTGTDIETFSWLITWPSDQRKFSKLTCQTFTTVCLRKFSGRFVVAAAAGAAAEGRQLFVWFLVLNIFMVFFFIVRLSDNFWRIYHNLRFGTWFFLEKFMEFVEKRRLLLRSSVSGLLAFFFVEAIRTYWSVYSCFAGIFITVFVACRSNKIAYFLPYRPLSGTRN